MNDGLQTFDTQRQDAGWGCAVFVLPGLCRAEVSPADTLTLLFSGEGRRLVRRESSYCRVNGSQW
jgi:hypothetical protein